MNEPLALLVALIVMLIGLIGSVVPLLPGPPIIWLGALVYAWATEFQMIGWGTLAILGVLAIVAATSDVWMSALGNKSSGESLFVTLTSLVGGVVGLLLFNLPGMLIGSILGVIIPNWQRWRERGYLFTISWRVIKSWLLGILIQGGIGVIMIAIFLVRVFTA